MRKIDYDDDDEIFEFFSNFFNAFDRVRTFPIPFSRYLGQKGYLKSDLIG